MKLKINKPTLSEVIQKGKSANWKKLDFCPCCGSVCWWHGFRERWCSMSRVLIRRVICSCCKKSWTLLPYGFWKRFQASKAEIIKSCSQRINHNIWHKGFERQQICWWVKVAQRMIRFFGDLDTAIQKYPDHLENRPLLSRFWLTHQRVS